MTLSPSFPMEIAKRKYEMSISRQQRKRDAKTKELLCAKIGNRISVGRATFERYYQPHNYRLYFDFDRTDLDHGSGDFKTCNHESEYELKMLLNGCKIRLKKTQAEVINLNHLDYAWRILVTGLDELTERMTEIINYLDHECQAALMMLVKKYGGFSKYEVLKRRDEEGIMLDPVLDSLPSRFRWHDFPFSKKVYEDKVEILDSFHAQTYMKNRMIEEFDHTIAESIEENSFICDPICWLKLRIKTVNDVFDFEDKIRSLSKRGLSELSKYLFSLSENSTKT